MGAWACGPWPRATRWHATAGLELEFELGAGRGTTSLTGGPRASAPREREEKGEARAVWDGTGEWAVRA
jgi:hypothetical protein